MQEKISVYIRLKPTETKNDSVFSYDTKTITDSKTNEVFSFDYIITPSQTTGDLFENLIKKNITSLLKGINISIIAFGQTNSGKTFTMKGEPKANDGLIFLSIKEIFNLLNSNESNITKPLIKMSFSEIYNETVNDLIDTNKKNLEIRESPKGVYINNLSEYTISNYEKALQILNKLENNKNITEAKLNEKSGKRHTIFKLNLEFNIKEKKYFSQLNLVDLAGSENIAKVNGNINKSIIAFNSVINKLSQNNKNFINYKESKLTRLLQHSLGANSKTTIICTLIDDSEHYSENLNTLKFGIKVKNIKILVKENEIHNDKKNINKDKENQALRNKIKLLEKIINDKKSNKENRNNNFNSNYKCMTASKNKNNNSNKKISSLLNTVSKKDEQISNLEKEVSMLKKLLTSNKKLEHDINSFQNHQDWINTQGDMYNNIHNMSSYKSSLNQRINNLSALRGSGSAIKNIYFNSPKIQRHHQSEFYNNSNLKQIEGFNYNFNKNISMTEMRQIPKNYFYSAIRKTAPQNNNFLFGSNIKTQIPELNITNNNLDNNNNTNNDFLIKENEELKKNINDLKKTYNDVVQSKEQQILLLNQNHDMTLENCEKLIKEAESNYIKIKKEYDQVKEKIIAKENELSDLKQKKINQDNSINYYMNELNKMKDVNYANEIEAKYNSLLEENIKLKQKEEEETSKLKEENDLIKKNIEMIENKFKEKCKELNENQKKNNEEKKQIEKELQKYRIELKNFRNTQGKKILTNKTNNNESTNINDNNIIDNDKIKEYEDRISQLTQENTQYKNNLEQIEKTQIVEYQKLLDDSFLKIAQLNKELNESKDKNNYLEKALSIVEKTTKKNSFNFSPYNNKENDNNNKDFLSKKRKIPKIYQDIIDNQQNNKNSNKETNIQTPNEENNNMPVMEFSNFEI